MGVLLAKALVLAVITVAPSVPCDTASGCAVPPDRIYLATGYWGSPAAWTDAPDQWFAYDGSDMLNRRNHELGHIVDYNLLTDQDRGMFKALIRDRRIGWRLPVDSPHEQFAEAFRLCAISVRYVSRYESLGYGYHPTLYQHRKVCKWLATV